MGRCFKTDADLVREAIGMPAALENLAEECAELSHEVLKYARVLRKENPTPVTEEEAKNNVFEEFADVMLCSDICGIQLHIDDYEAKLDRAITRIDEAKKEMGK